MVQTNGKGANFGVNKTRFLKITTRQTATIKD
jgi:hypothetical protein